MVSVRMGHAYHSSAMEIGQFKEKNYAWKYVCRSINRISSWGYHQSWRTNGLLRKNVLGLDWSFLGAVTIWNLGTYPSWYSHYPIGSWCHDFVSHLLGKRKLGFDLNACLTIKNKKRLELSRPLFTFKRDHGRCSDWFFLYCVKYGTIKA